MSEVALVIRRKSDYCLGRSCEFYPGLNTGYFDIQDEISLWDDTFSMPYFDVRKRLHEIAFSDLGSLGFDLVFDHIDDQVIERIRRLEDFWIVPVDDDDWLSPNLVPALKQINSEETMCHWKWLSFSPTSIASGVPILQEGSRKGMDALVSCSYAVRPCAEIKNITNHSHTKGLSSFFVEGAFSFYVRTPASVILLKRHKERGLKVLDMWRGMQEISEHSVPVEFRSKIGKLKQLFKECRPLKTVL